MALSTTSLQIDLPSDDVSLEPAASRSAAAKSRLEAARAELTDCHLCGHHCGVDRLAGELGLCKAGSAPRVFSAQVEVSDELELVPVFAIALAGCDLRCDFCITGAESWNPAAGSEYSAEALAHRAAEALAAGARTIMILGGEPTIHLPAVIELVAALPDSAQLIWKTNGHCSAKARSLLNGLFDIWLVDFKFGNDSCGKRLARTPPGYPRSLRENLLWAHRHSSLIVRHLLMPGHVDCCWSPVARWLAENTPGAKVNLRTGFWPAWHSHRHPELSHTTTDLEAERAHCIAAHHQLRLIE